MSLMIILSTFWCHYGFCETHNLFAVFVKGGFNKQCAQSKTQSVICVSNAGLPARSARLYIHRRERHKGNSYLIQGKHTQLISQSQLMQHPTKSSKFTFLVPYRLSSSLSWAFSKRWSRLDAPFCTRFQIM